MNKIDSLFSCFSYVNALGSSSFVFQVHYHQSVWFVCLGCTYNPYLPHALSLSLSLSHLSSLAATFICALATFGAQLIYLLFWQLFDRQHKQNNKWQQQWNVQSWLCVLTHWQKADWITTTTTKLTACTVKSFLTFRLMNSRPNKQKQT